MTLTDPLPGRAKAAAGRSGGALACEQEDTATATAMSARAEPTADGTLTREETDRLEYIGSSPRATCCRLPQANGRREIVPSGVRESAGTPLVRIRVPNLRFVARAETSVHTSCAIL